MSKNQNNKKRNKIYNPKAGDTLEYGMEYANLSIGLNMDDLDVEDRWCLENEDLVLMQSTGLKDKNGKLIYEGDILKHEWDHFPPYAVEWWSQIDDQWEWAGFGLEYDTESQIIIGNIYENPELLATNKPI